MRFGRHFDLDGVRVHADGEGDDLERVVDLLLAPYAAAAPAGPPHVRIVIERRCARPQQPATPPRFAFPPLGAWPVDGGFRLVDDVADLTMIASAHGATITGWLTTGVPLELISRFAGLTLWVALMECLRARGRYPLHGAALVSPSTEVVVLAGTKCAGKSTATLALAERGYRVLTDDTLFVEADPRGAPSLIGYKKRFHVRPDLLERRPDLVPLARMPAPFEPQDKRWLDLEERIPGCTVTRAGAPALILLPRIIDAAHTTLTPVASRTALMALMAESSFVFVRPELTRPHLAILGALVDGARCARLDAGRDLLAQPELYATLVADALAEARNDSRTPWASTA